MQCSGTSVCTPILHRAKANPSYPRAYLGARKARARTEPPDLLHQPLREPRHSLLDVSDVRVAIWVAVKEVC